MTLTLLWTNDIRLAIFDILIAIVLFIILYNLHFYIGKYLKVRRERENLELIIESLQKCINDKISSKQLRTDKSDRDR